MPRRYLGLNMSMVFPKFSKFVRATYVKNKPSRMGPLFEFVVPNGLKPELTALVLGKPRNGSVVPIGIP